MTPGISINELSNNVLVDIKKKDVKNAVDNLIEKIEQRHKHKFDDESIKEVISNHIRLIFENAQTALMLGKIEALNNSVCSKYEYKCSENSEVCANCRALKDKIFDSENATIGVNFLPIHPYCRCDIIGINADGERVQFDDGNNYTPEILNEMRDLLTALWKSTQTRTDKAFNQPNFYNISNYLTIGAFDAIKNMFLQNGIRGEKAFSNPSVYNVGNWLSSGLFDTVKGTFNPEKPLSLQHWLDSLSTALITMPVVQKAGSLIDDVANATYKDAGIKLKPQSLMDELSNSGNKFAPDDVVTVTKTPEGKLVWLEKGNPSAGLQHIETHASQFAAKGINIEQIPEFITKAVTEGKVVGMQGTRPIYEVVFNGQTQRVSITVGGNGFIVGANPVSLP